MLESSIVTTVAATNNTNRNRSTNYNTHNNNNYSKNNNNLELELDSEADWPAVDLGNLIIDLDADIDKSLVTTMSTTSTTTTKSAVNSGNIGNNHNNKSGNSSNGGQMLNNSNHAGADSASNTNSSSSSSSNNSERLGGGGLKMKIKRTKSGNVRNPEGKLEIVQQQQQNNGGNNTFMNGSEKMNAGANAPLSAEDVLSAATAAVKQSGKGAILNSGKVKLTGNGSNMNNSSKTNGKLEMNNSKPNSNGKNSSSSSSSSSSVNGQDSSSSGEPTAKRMKVDAGVCTEIATMTEPDELGPMDPGSSVSLEGIVWHETENGILVINVTWRGKTYVGTLLDSTRHVNQWAPPRYSDSPTLELESRTPKGRGKRGNRGAAGTPVESETRGNLRSSKGRSRNQINFSSSSPSKDKQRNRNKDEYGSGSDTNDKKRPRTSSRNSPDDDEDSEKEKDNDNKSESESKEIKEEDELTPKDIEEEKYIPPPPLPYALSCPKQGCKKRYRHHNGLKFHVSFAHKELLNSQGDIKDMSEIERLESVAKNKIKEKNDLKPNEPENTAEESSNSDPSSKTSTPGPSDTQPTSTDASQALPNPAVVSSGSVMPPLPSLPLHRQGAEEANKLQIPLAALSQLKPTNFNNKLPIPPADAKPIPVSAIEGGVVPNSRPPPPLLNGPPPMTLTAGGLPVTTIYGNLPISSTGIMPKSSSNSGPSRGVIRPPINARPIVPATAPQMLAVGGLGPSAVNLKPIQPRPTIMADPTPNLSLDELRRAKKEPKKKKDSNSPGTSPPRNMNGSSPKSSISKSDNPNAGKITPEQQQAKSPAYSDISDDNDDSTDKKMLAEKKRQEFNNRPPFSVGPPHLPFPYVLPQSSPQLPTVPVSSAAIISKTNNELPSKSDPKDKLVTGPQPGSLEYQKMLQAYGFPPFPYPIPPGMDPHLHIHLLSSDPSYKAKHDKERAEKEKAFKDQIDRDNREKDRRASVIGGNKVQQEQESSPLNRRTPEDLRKKTNFSPITSVSGGLSVKPEFNLKSEPVKTEAGTVKPPPVSEEGAKPTMETRGPPPGIANPYGYMHPSMMRPGFPGLPYDMGLSQLLMGSPYGPNPYMNNHLRPPFSGVSMADFMRPPFLPPSSLPEDLSRSAAALVAVSSGMSTTKALDLLQQHANQYHKIQELQERAMRSPGMDKRMSPKPRDVSPSPNQNSRKGTPSPASQGPMASLSSLTSTTASSQSKSPPPLRHVHTHTHTHFGLGYPLLPPPSAVPSSLVPPAAHTPFPPGAFPNLMPPKSSGFPPPK